MKKNYRKSLLAMMITTALPVIVVAATGDTTIYVTTLSDEDGENTSACSLREAVIAAKTNKAYGGCIAGQSAGTDNIKLKQGGVYILKGTIEIDSPLSINGADAVTYDRPDSVAATVPARIQLNTTIEGNGTFPLFSSITQQSAINLNTVILKKGGGVKGGAIRAGGVVNLNRVYILDSKATEQGGAIYLDGTNSALSATDTIFYNNQAPRGALLSMSCQDSLGLTKRSIRVDRSSILSNGSTASVSILDYCGAPTASISASTIANNIVSTVPPNVTTTPKILPSGIIRYIHVNDESPLDITISSLTITSNTIVNNSGWAALLYDNVGALNLSYNVLAFNKGGKSCRYLQYETTGQQLSDDKAKVKSVYDAIVVDKGATSTNPVDECYLPIFEDETDDDETEDDQRHTHDLTTVRNNFNDLFYPLPPFNSDLIDSIENNKALVTYGYLPGYIPKAGNAKSLIDTGGSGCSVYDQRGLSRNIRLSTTIRPGGNLCDKGAIEISKLYAADMTGVTNLSMVVLLKNLESTIKDNKDTLAGLAEDSPYIVNYQQAIADQEAQLAALKVVNPERAVTQRYRQAYVSILTNSVPKEFAGIGIKQFLKDDGTFNDKDYVVKAYAVGRASKSFVDELPDNPKVIETKYPIIHEQAQYIKCIWSPVLRQVLVSRLELADVNNTPDNNKDDIPLPVRTPDGSAEYCYYTIALKSNPSVEKYIGYIQASIVNIAPIATDDKFTLKYGNPNPVQMDILANDNDDGDGTSNVPGYPVGRNLFYKDDATRSYANIKITSPGIVPTRTGFKTNIGNVVTFEYVQPCPNTSTTTEDETCYGGKMVFQPDNIFTPFNDSFTYKVLDADKLESNEATVSIINTATTTDDTRGNSGSSTGTGGGGGGSFGWLAIAGLGMLAVARRRLTR